MSSPSEAAKANAPAKEKNVSEVDKAAKMKSTLDQPQSVLRKSPVGPPDSRKLVKLLPKTAIPLKTLHGPNGNIIVHGPHNKLVSLHVKNPTALKTQASQISLLPINFPKDVKPTNKIPALTLIGSRPKGAGKEVFITKAMIPQNISKSLLSTNKSKNITTNMVASTSCNLQKTNNKDKDLSVNTTSHISLLTSKSKDISNGPQQTLVTSIMKSKDTMLSSCPISTPQSSFTSITKPKDISSLSSLTLTPHSSVIKSKDSLSAIIPTSTPQTSTFTPIIKAKDTLSSSSPVTTPQSSIASNIKSKEALSSSSPISTPLSSSSTAKSKDTLHVPTCKNSVLLSAKPKETTINNNPSYTANFSDNVLKAKLKSNLDIETSITAINSKSILCTKNLKEISISKTTACTGSETKAKDSIVSKSIIQHSPGTILKTKGLEIKAVSVPAENNTLSPAQAATVLSKSVPIRHENIDITPAITIEKKKSLSAMLTKDLIQTAINTSFITRPIPLSLHAKGAAEVSILKRVTPHNSQENNEKEANKKSSEEFSVDNKTNDGGLIRVRNIETLTQCNNKPKPRQQSLLKNKTIEKLKRSPRTKGRSKSLTALLSKNKQKSVKPSRRLSSSSDTNLKRSCKPSLGESLLKALRDGESPKPDNSLLCHEKLEISPSNNTLQSNSISLSVELKAPLSDPIKTEPISTTPEPEGILPHNDQIMEDLKSSKSRQLDACSLLDWKNGIGLSKACKYNFQLNEFGLLEINEDNKARGDSTYDKPIYEREFKSQNTADYSDPLYFCKGCNCHGAAVDFLFPDFCSHECIQRYSAKNLPKKYSNRKKDGKVKQQSHSSTDNILLPPFNWTFYLKACKGEPAPIDLFPNPFPCGPNLFKNGMKLEAIDPEHSNLFCVCTIIEKKGYRLKLHFDGYSKKHDFWVNADSMDIFPPGWCSKTNRMLQPPKGMSQLTFNWPMYLNRTRSIPSPRNLFTHLNSSSNTNPFEIGMKLEADDLRNTRKVCVASVADVLDNRILIHFDGWDESYDYWIDINSPYIHPVDWHEKNGFSIVSPPDWEDHFDWKSYLNFTRCTPATEELFSTREPISFQAGMKLEVVDKKSPSLIRPATVVMADEYEIKVLFDGWPEKYAFWVVDDSPDIHPVGWCEATGHDLESPPGFESLLQKFPCSISGCRGIGNAIRPEMDYHTSVEQCPYEICNWNIEMDRSQRLEEATNVPSEGNMMSTKRKLDETIDFMHPKFFKLDLSDSNSDKKRNTNTRINVSQQLLCDYGPRLQFIHNLWTRNSECLTKHITEPIVTSPLNWSVEEVSDYIRRLPRCQAISEEFKKQQIDGAALLSIRQNDLTDIMNIKLGPAIKIYNIIVQLREEVVTNFSSFLSLPN